MKHYEVKRLLQQEIDFKEAARELRKLQIEIVEDHEEDAWEIYYDEFSDSPTLHYGSHLNAAVNKSDKKDLNEAHNELCDLFDEVFTDLLNEELKTVKLTIEEN